MTDLPERLRTLADKIEAEQAVPEDLDAACGDGMDVRSVDAEGWDQGSDYLIGFKTDDVGFESRNITEFTTLAGYRIDYVVWGDRTEVDEWDVQLNVSEVDG